MECVIPGKNLKVFSKCIHCMSKIGENLFIESANNGIILRTINSARSAFVSFTLNRAFFEQYQTQGETAQRKYQVRSKACYAVFHNVANVERVVVTAKTAENRLVFDLSCKHGIRKKHVLPFELQEPLSAVYDRDNMVNRLVVRPKQIVDMMGNFHTHLDEISLIAGKSEVKLKSYVDESKSALSLKTLQTELTLDKGEFEEYNLQDENVEITFSVKEFKAVMALCDAVGQPCTLNIERSGRPILLNLRYYNMFEADFVLATLIVNDTPSTTSSQTSDVTHTPTTPNTSSSFGTSSLSPKRGKVNRPQPSPSPSPSVTHQTSDGSRRFSDEGSSTSPKKRTATPYHHKDRGMSEGEEGEGDGEGDDYVGGSPIASPRKKTKNAFLSQMLGANKFDDNDEEMAGNAHHTMG